MLYLALTFVDESSLSLFSWWIFSLSPSFFLMNFLSLSLFLDEFSISYGLMFLMWDTALIINLTGHPFSFPDSATVCVYCLCLLLCVFIVYVYCLRSKRKQNKSKSSFSSVSLWFPSINWALTLLIRNRRRISFLVFKLILLVSRWTLLRNLS